ncbi:TPA: hypothetical protein DEP94_03985 [Candidatus Nomurabacteria bacterium]|nr:hypothetical protein [Candidatus Nomurabacteria bacterium]
MLENSRTGNTMDLEAEVTKEIWLVLQKLKKYSLLTPSDEYIKYGIADISSIEDEAHRKILHKLEAEGVLSIKAEMPIDNNYLTGLSLYGYKSFFYKIALTEAKFEEVYIEYARMNNCVSLPVGDKKLQFDAKTSRLFFNGRECQIPVGSNQEVLCKALFALPIGEWLRENDVINNFFKGKKSNRSFYDAIQSINRSTEADLRVSGVLKYSASKVCIDKEKFE